MTRYVGRHSPLHCCFRNRHDSIHRDCVRTGQLDHPVRQQNLDQWVGDGTATFKIEDGSIIATDKKDPKAVAAYLVSKQSFKDFEIPRRVLGQRRRNSGIFVRNTDPKNISSKSAYEVNIFDQRPDPSMGTGGIVPFAKTVPIKAGGKWNTYEIVAKGPKILGHAERHQDRRRRRECRPQGRPILAIRRRHCEIPQGQIKPLPVRARSHRQKSGPAAAGGRLRSNNAGLTPQKLKERNFAVRQSMMD